jgi:hypothetical protein
MQKTLHSQKTPSHPVAELALTLNEGEALAIIGGNLKIVPLRDVLRKEYRMGCAEARAYGDYDALPNEIWCSAEKYVFSNVMAYNPNGTTVVCECSHAFGWGTSLASALYAKVVRNAEKAATRQLVEKHTRGPLSGGYLLGDILKPLNIHFTD